MKKGIEAPQKQDFPDVLYVAYIESCKLYNGFNLWSFNHALSGRREWCCALEYSNDQNSRTASLPSCSVAENIGALASSRTQILATQKKAYVSVGGSDRKTYASMAL